MNETKAEAVGTQVEVTLNGTTVRLSIKEADRLWRRIADATHDAEQNEMDASVQAPKD